MGLFRRSREDHTTSAAPARPSGVAAPSAPRRDGSDVDLAQARSVITALCSAVGADLAMRAAVAQLLRVSGTPDPANTGAQMAAYRSDPQFLTRPWRWLCTVARRAIDEQEPELAAMALFWTEVWRTSVEPGMSGLAAMNIGFDRAPNDAYDELRRHAAVAIRRLPEDYVIATTAEPATITCGSMRAALGVAPDPPDRPDPQPAVQVAPDVRAQPAAPAQIDPEEKELRVAARAGDTDAAVKLGEILHGRGDLDMAQNAYEWAESKGNVEAGLKLAALMEDHRKDLVAAEAAWRRADDAGHVNGAGNLGRLLADKGDLRGAEAAFRRAVDRGSLRALAGYAGLLMRRDSASAEQIAEAVDLMCGAEDRFELERDLDAAPALIVFEGMRERCSPAALEAGVRRADARGSACGAWRLGFLLRLRGDLREALIAFDRAIDRGHPQGWARAAEVHLALGDTATAEAVARQGERAGAASASTMLGAILDERGDTDGGLEAYRRADAGGDAGGSFNLGIELRSRGELRGAEAALKRAADQGWPNADAALAQVRRRMR